MDNPEKRCSCLIYIICVCFRMVMSNTYCVVFLFCFSSSLILEVSLDCPFFISPSVWSNVYFNVVFQCVLIVLSFYSTYSLFPFKANKMRAEGLAL
jgi:hypothetical protein